MSSSGEKAARAPQGLSQSCNLNTEDGTYCTELLYQIEMAKISLFTAVAFHHNSAISDCDRLIIR